MPPSPEKKPDPANSGLDISKILLPKKETGPNVDSAQRVNAGALLAQEEAAELPKTEPHTPVRLTPTPPPPAPAPAPAAPGAPAPAPAIPAQETPAVPLEESSVRPLQTYKGDLESVVTEKGVSVVSIAAAEAARRGKEPLKTETPEEKEARQRSWAMVIGGASLLLLALGVLAVVFLRPTSVTSPQLPKSPFITTDETAKVLVPAGHGNRDEVMTNLLAARQQAKLSLGLIEWLRIVEPSSEKDGIPRTLSFQEFLGIIAPQAPAELTRTLGNGYTLGLHSFDENQPFLLFQVDAYEPAYAGMLIWERTMRDDLSPFFSRTPSPRQNGQPLATSTPQFLQTGFLDKVVENRDTRAIVNDSGDILLLWTFLGRDTILITTNEYTLREVLSRMTASPVVPIPSAQ